MSRGIAARKPGETFHSLQTNETIHLTDIVLVPDRNRKPDRLSGWDLIEVNQPISSSQKSAIIALFDNNKGYVKYVTNVDNSGHGKWNSSDFKRETGFARTTGASASENLPIKPSDLIGDEIGRTIPEMDKHVSERLLGALEGKLIDNQCYEHLSLLFDAKNRTGNNSPLLKNGLKYSGAYNKYLSEILAPMSVISDWLTKDRGVIGELHPLFLRDDVLENAKVTYFQSLTNVLIDSQITYTDPNTGTNVNFGISSKVRSGGGAAASIASLVQVINGMSQDTRQKLEIAFPLPIRILKTISENNQVAGIIELSRMFGILGDEEQEFVQQLFASSNLSTLEEFTTSHHASDISPVLLGMFMNMGDTTPYDLLKKKSTGGDVNPSYRPAYHILAGLAKQVSQHINQNIASLDQCIREILKHNNLYQVYSSISVDGSDLRYNEFKVVYPSSYTGKIQINSSKTYYMTAIKGKLCFKLK